MEKSNTPLPKALPLKLLQRSCIAAKCVAPHQQRYAALRSTVPSRNSVKEAAIQWLSPVLGSDDVVAIVDLGLVVLLTVVLVTVFLSDVVAGFTAGSVAGSAPG